MNRMIPGADRCSIGAGTPKSTTRLRNYYTEETVKASIFLAASAFGVNGEINALRIGLSTVAPGKPFAVGAVIEIPYLVAVDQHTVRIELVDQYGTPFEFSTPDGETHQVLIENTGGTGIPPRHPVGSPRIIAFAKNFALPLAWGTRYEFRLSIDDETDDAWVVGFDTPPAPLTQAEAA